MTLDLKKFDMKNISFRPDENKGPVIVLIGRRDTGKSYLVRDLLYYHQDIPIGTVISGTEAGNGFFRSSTLHDTDTLTQPTNNTKNSTKKIFIYKTIKYRFVISLCYLLLL